MKNTENSRKNALKWDKIREISYDEKEFVSQKLIGARSAPCQRGV